MAAAALLPAFLEQLQAWEAAVAEGGAAVGELSGGLARLQPTEGQSELPGVHKNLSELAPSFRLEGYLQQLQRGPTATPDAQLAAGMSDAYTAVQEAVADARTALQAAQDVSQRCTRAVLDAPLPSADTGTALAADADADAAGGLEQGSSSLDAAAQPASLAGEELALLMSAVAAGMARDCDWMERVVAWLSLGSPPGELGAVETLWQLQPFTDGAAVRALAAAGQAGVGDTAAA